MSVYPVVMIDRLLSIDVPWLAHCPAPAMLKNPTQLRTYARRRPRTRLNNTTASSPLRPIQHENLSLSEMKHRMLKRARHHSRDDNQMGPDARAADEEHDQKRARC